jgi:hypothetical protein
METLKAAYRDAKANDGAPGLDGVSFEDISFLRIFARSFLLVVTNRAVQTEQSFVSDLPKSTNFFTSRHPLYLTRRRMALVEPTALGSKLTDKYDS